MSGEDFLASGESPDDRLAAENVRVAGDAADVFGLVVHCHGNDRTEQRELASSRERAAAARTNVSKTTRLSMRGKRVFLSLKPVNALPSHWIDHRFQAQPQEVLPQGSLPESQAPDDASIGPRRRNIARPTTRRWALKEPPWFPCQS